MRNFQGFLSFIMRWNIWWQIYNCLCQVYIGSSSTPIQYSADSILEPCGGVPTVTHQNRLLHHMWAPLPCLLQHWNDHAEVARYKPCDGSVPWCRAHHFTQQLLAKGGLGRPPVHILKHHPQVSDWHGVSSWIGNADCGGKRHVTYTYIYINT